MPDEPSTTPRESLGNGCLLVLCDSSRAEFAHLPEVVFAALAHFGIPYRLWNLAHGPLQSASLDLCAGLIIAQEHLGATLSTGEVRALAQAVNGGLGLINFDHDVDGYGDSILGSIGLEARGSTGRATVTDAAALVINDNEHFVSYAQDAATVHHLRMPVPATLVASSHGAVRVLAQSPDGAPLLAVGTLGAGRVVQWLASPKLWTRQYFGHARGLDDLFWRGIVWAARKPFVMKAMPPFVRLRFDDCQGLWQAAADLHFVDALKRFGHKPTLCICVRAVAPDGGQKLHELYRAGDADIAPHTLQPGASIFYGDQRGEYSLDELNTIMREVDDHFSRWQVRPSRILSDHDHEYSPRVVPLLKARGITFKMNITLPGERWNDVHVDWRPAPYGTMNYALDFVPGTKDLFVVFNHYPTFDAARSYLPDGRRFLYNRSGGFGEQKWDFLSGLTVSSSPTGRNDIEAAARRLATHTRLGLDSLFFGGSISHSHFARDLSEKEWAGLLERYEALTPRHVKMNVSYDFLVEYAQSKVDTHLAEVELDRNSGRVSCTVVGEATVPLQLYVFHDADDGVEQSFEPVPVFQGEVTVAF